MSLLQDLLFIYSLLKTAFRASNSITNHLRNKNPHFNHKHSQSVAYSLTCSECIKRYVGRSERIFSFT